MPVKKSIIHEDDLTAFVFLGFFMVWIEIMRLKQAVYGTIFITDWLVLLVLLELICLFLYYKVIAPDFEYRTREEEFREIKRFEKKSFNW